MKAHVVCETCNNTWMSDLDGEAKATMKDMIQYGAWISLLPRGIETIAAFAFKTAVIADQLRPVDHPFFSHTARKRFAVSLDIPVGVQVWLSFFKGKALSGNYITHSLKLRVGHYRAFEFYVFTYVAGFLALQLTAPRWASITKKPPSFPGLTQDPRLDRVSVPLWPSNGTPLEWPGNKYLDDDSLDGFATRWSQLRESPF